ncbi:hypothetical protein SAMN06295974_0588 [Plantibacter flavus]|uniref:UPF0182 protein EDD42_1414 n=1 Tax=Plantibacter flavus TaxID=150123 RepID=A0A3N2C1H8_9MICO|nr:UPF0182 family protein [Plantibacter flavus]ROR81358.1 hypothetical protein EDD42_1414 [Plantibacter flavus]SMG11864.1 hypothetical protein SAMN06295974_0588 [Plantibacter flavus]
MTSAAAEKPLSTQRRRAPIAITVAIIAALLIGFFVFSGFYADLLWFQQLGFTEVLTTQWIAAIAMFLVGFVGMALPVWLAIEIAYRTRPVYAKLSSQVDRYQQVVEPLRRLATYGIPALFGLFGGVAAASRWQLVLLWMNGTPSGTKDPQFNLDVSFYLFDLPFFQAVVAFSSAVVLIALIATAVVTYLYGGIRVVSREVWISMAARVQISVLAALYLILQAVSLWLDQYTTLNDTGTLITGASYTDVAATIPGRVILAGIALMVAVLFVVTAFTGRWRLPLVGTALLIVASLIVGSLYPWIVQRFQVEPNAKSLETPYIKRNIDMTRDAYGIAGVEEEEYAATTDATPGALRQDAETTANIRIIDPSLVSASVAQLEQFKQFYSFDKQLDVDRYNIDGKTQDAVVAVRELNVAGLDNSQSWINNTVVYTHGYGLVAAYGNQRSASGEPVFLESGIPTTGALGDFEPRVYFGEQSPDYSIVGAPKGADPVELDYPSGTQGESQTYTTFDGDGGPKLDNVFKKLVYALKFQSEQIFLSDSVNSQSQILYDRDPLTRVQKVAPYLTLDSDPYPSVVDGQIVWIVDGYTTSASYPYSKTVSLSDTISDSVTPAQNYALDDVNYIRNSVKATVNAYDGKVTLYSWDDQDPILKTWQKVFPSTVKPMSDMSGDLMSHVRYPADLFKVQRSVLGQYHVTNAGSFYSSEDAWVTPNDPQSTDTEKKYQPPYYLTMQLPEQDAPSFSLYSTFIPRQGGEQSRNVLTGYLAVDANAGAEDGKRSSDYGKIRLLTLPKDDTVPGPGQVQNTFDSDPSVSSQINILKQGQTEVLNGNLLTVPVGGGLLYVQPVYVKSTGDTSFPLLQKVLVAFGDQIAFEDTLDEALDVLFGGDSGADAGDTNVPGDSTTPPTDGTDTGGGTDTGSTPSTGDPTVDAQIKTLLDQAKAAMVEKDAAMASGDWAAYGVADKKISDALAQALALLNG